MMELHYVSPQIAADSWWSQQEDIMWLFLKDPSNKSELSKADNPLKLWHNILLWTVCNTGANFIADLKGVVSFGHTLLLQRFPDDKLITGWVAAGIASDQL